MKTTVILAISMLVLLAACAPQARPEEKAAQVMKWGFISPLTGTATLYGQPALNAVQIAAEEINAAGGINGKRLEFVAEDGKCDGAAAVTAATKLIDVDKVKIIIGGHCSTESMAILPVTQAKGVFQFAGDTSSPAFTGKGKYALRITPSAAYYAGAQAEVAFKKGIKKVAVFNEQRDFPQGVVNSFTKRFKELGGEIISTNSFAPGTTDFRTDLLKIKDTNPDVVLFSAQGPDTTSLFFKQLKELGITLSVMGDPVTISKGAWAKSEGAMPSTAWAVTPHAVPDTNEISKHFAEVYLQKYGELPAIDFALVAENYDAIKLLAEVVAVCGEDDKDCIREKLIATKNRKGAVGIFSFGEDGDAVYNLAVVHIVDGKPAFEAIG